LEDHDLSTHLGKRAVVTGAGIGGLAAAGALADFFDEVIVLENDPTPTRLGPRPGTPQSGHTHALLIGGLKALGELFPGFENGLERAGAVPLRETLDIRRERPGYDPLPQLDLDMTVYSMSRPLLESVIRAHVQALGNVELRDCCKARRFVSAEKGCSVTGVIYEASGGLDDQIPADLFIDATGHGHLTLQYLASLGLPPPQETVVGVDVGYATAEFEIPGDATTDWKAAATYAHPPVNRRSAYIFPIEGNRWLVTNSGRYEDKPPNDEAGFIAHLRGVRTSTVYDALRAAKRCGPINRGIFRANRRRSFTENAASLGNLIPLGDTICQFNPVYGQGMSAASLQAVLLRRLLHEKCSDEGSLKGIAAEFISSVEPLVDAPWSMAVIPDFVDPLTEGDQPPDLRQSLKFSAAVLKLASGDREIYKLLMEVQQLLKPRSAYREPQLLARLQPIMQAMEKQ
jgi:2-polyprenyl-6-methoxyphenol hydroxylase-like FAD-dependent oxidoreductase